MVTTDVTSRGIDISEVSHVINFDVPLIYEDYVHRIGRTGRALRTGEAITFATEAEMYHVRKIEETIREKIPEVPLPQAFEITETPFEEQQAIAMEIDRQKHRENPDYKGAFHEKKERKVSSGKGFQKKKSSSKKNFSRKSKR